MERVYLVQCDRYNPQVIADGIVAAAQALEISLPHNQSVWLHPSCPWAHPQFAPHAFTSPAVLEGVMLALPGNTFTIATSSLNGFPTRYSYQKAGYVNLARRTSARLLALEELPTSQVSTSPDAVVDKKVSLPKWIQTGLFTVALPKLTGSTFLPYAGALRHHLSLFSWPTQIQNHHRLPTKLVDLLHIAPPNLIVVDAIHATHEGGELSGRPVPLNVLMIGTNPVAVDAICAIAYGLNPIEMPHLQAAAERGYGPIDPAQITVLGDLTLGDLKQRSQQVKRVDPLPEHYPLPPQVRVVRSPKADLAGTAGGLTEVFLTFEHAGISWKKSRETTLVIGHVDSVPKGQSDLATILFLDDTSRVDSYHGYSRIARLRGRNIPLSKLLTEVPYILQIGNLRNSLGGEMLLARLISSLMRWYYAWLDRSGNNLPGKEVIVWQEDNT